jgi:pullulanase/glycogen debranching enzyme
MLAIERRVHKRIYLIAEPWALGGTQWGKGDIHGIFASTRWAVWNDEFRESARTFVTGCGDHHNRDLLMRAITGSNVEDGGWSLRPQQSINYISCHDGRTLADLVGGDKRRVFLGILLVLTAQGVPMLGEGSELMYSKKGHDNSYNRPDLNQIDWNNARQHQDLVTAVAKLIALRQRIPHFRYTTHLRQRSRNNGHWDIDWIFPTGYPHQDNCNAIGFIIRPPRSALVCLRRWRMLAVLLNGSGRGADFCLPKGRWKLVADGDRILVDERGVKGVPHAQGDYHVCAGTGVVLAPA